MALTHFDAKGDAQMVDVSDKPATSRIAVAKNYIKMLPETFDIITEGRAKKGDVLGVARLAGIMAAKQTARTAHGERHFIFPHAHWIGPQAPLR